MQYCLYLTSRDRNSPKQTNESEEGEEKEPQCPDHHLEREQQVLRCRDSKGTSVRKRQHTRRAESGLRGIKAPGRGTQSRMRARHTNSAVHVLTYPLPVIVGKSTACRFPLVWGDLLRVGTSENAHKQLPARNGCGQGIREQKSKAVCPIPFRDMYVIEQTNADRQGGSRLEKRTSRAGNTPKTHWTPLDGAKVFACSVARVARGE
jgi:hypothetical protein